MLLIWRQAQASRILASAASLWMGFAFCTAKCRSSASHSHLRDFRTIASCFSFLEFCFCQGTSSSMASSFPLTVVRIRTEICWDLRFFTWCVRVSVRSLLCSQWTLLRMTASVCKAQKILGFTTWLIQALIPGKSLEWSSRAVLIWCAKLLFAGTTESSATKYSQCLECCSWNFETLLIQANKDIGRPTSQTCWGWKLWVESCCQSCYWLFTFVVRVVHIKQGILEWKRL